MTIDERIEALTMNSELMSHEIEGLKVSTRDLVTASKQDGENIRALVRLAEIHERRLTDLEDHQ